MIIDLKLKGTASLIGVALLTSLSNQYVCTDLLHLLFSLCHNVRTKYGSLSRLGPTQGSTVGTSIKCLKW
jgi:hypothetical protein